jgi:hypothetical protein
MHGRGEAGRQKAGKAAQDKTSLHTHTHTSRLPATSFHIFSFQSVHGLEIPVLYLRLPGCLSVCLSVPDLT